MLYFILVTRNFLVVVFLYHLGKALWCEIIAMKPFQLKRAKKICRDSFLCCWSKYVRIPLLGILLDFSFSPAYPWAFCHSPNMKIPDICFKLKNAISQTIMVLGHLALHGDKKLQLRSVTIKSRMIWNSDRWDFFADAFSPSLLLKFLFVASQNQFLSPLSWRWVVIPGGMRWALQTGRGTYWCKYIIGSSLPVFIAFFPSDLFPLLLPKS